MSDNHRSANPARTAAEDEVFERAVERYRHQYGFEIDDLITVMSAGLDPQAVATEAAKRNWQSPLAGAHVYPAWSDDPQHIMNMLESITGPLELDVNEEETE